MKEDIMHPSRYCRNGIEVWDIEKAFAAKPENNVPHFVEHLRFGAVEYILRCWEKNGVQDLEKAAFLLSRTVEEISNYRLSTWDPVAEPTRDVDEDKTSNVKFEKMHPLQNTIRQDKSCSENIDGITISVLDICAEISKFMDEHGGIKPKVVNLSREAYNDLKADIDLYSAKPGLVHKQNDNSIRVLDVSVAVSDSIKNNNYIEVL